MILRLILESLFVFVALLGIFTLGFFAGDGTIDAYFSKSDFNQTNVNMTFGSEMNETEIIVFKTIVGELDPRYLAYVKNIHVGKNRTEMKLDSDQCTEAYGEKGCGGWTLNGMIVVEWKSVGSMKNVLCHELLHDYIKVKSNKASVGLLGYIHEDANHAVIDDLGNKKVCFG